MNGEIPSVPITTLAGVSSLVDLLPEMPLPTPLPQTLSNKSLLFHPRVAEEAQRLLAINDDNLIPQLVHSLSQTSSQNIDLKDQFLELPVDHQTAPTLLSGILMRRPDVFNGMIDHSMNMNWGDGDVQSQHQMHYGMNSMAGLSQHHPQHPSHHGSPLIQNAHHSLGHLGGGLTNPHHHSPGIHNADPLLNRMNAAPSLHLGNLDMLGHQHPKMHLNNDNPHLRGSPGRPLPPSVPASFNSINSAELGAHYPHQFNNESIHSSPRGRPPQPPLQPNISMSANMNLNMNANDLANPQNLHKLFNKDNSINSRGPSGLEINMIPVQQKLTPNKQHHHHPQQNDNNTSVLSLHSVFQDNSEMLTANFNVPTTTSKPHLGLPVSASGNATAATENDLNHATNSAQNQAPLKMSLKENLQMTRLTQFPPTSGASGNSVGPGLYPSVVPPVAVQMPIPSQISSEPLPKNQALTPAKRKEDLAPLQQPTGVPVPMSMPRIELKPLPMDLINQHQSKPNVKPNLNANINVQSKTSSCSVKIESNDRVHQHLKKLERSEVPHTPSTPPNNRLGGRSTSRNYHETTSEEEVEESESPSKSKKGKIFKTKTPEKRKRSERRSGDLEFSSPQSESRESKMRRSSTASRGAEEVDNADDTPKKKIRRVERMLIPVLEKLNTGNILDNNTYHRFLKTMDIVLDNMEYIERNEVDLDEDGNVPSELLIPKHQLNELCSEAAKLKALGAMEAIPADKIVRLLTLLEKNIRDGSRVTPLADPDDNEDESRLWLELTMESITRGVLASLTALHILTSQNMPKRAYLEDLIDRIVLFTKFQLQNTIYPTFDPVYRVDPRGKDGFASGKRKRSNARGVREKSMVSFYNKIHEVVGLLSELLNVQILTDTTVLHLSTLGVAPFFVENVSELQLSALKLVTCVFTQYEKHRRLLLDDILASIARLPSSKRSLRTFRLSSGGGSEEYIQMLTALVLQLIQCVTFLPDKLGSKGKRINSEIETDFGKEKPSNSDRDMMIANKFDTAMRTAGNFLTVFLSKCGSKSEDCDYRVLFENFVQDLLSTVNKPQWPAAELLLSLLGTLLVKNLGNKSLEVTMRVASLEYLGVAASRLRKDAVSAQVKMNTIDRIIADIKSEDEQIGDEDPAKEAEPGTIEYEEGKTEFLQRLLLDYLAVHGQSDPALMHARHFFISAWWKSAPNDITKSIRGNISTPNSKQSRNKKRKKKKSESSEEESVSEDSEQDEATGNEKEIEINSKVLTMTEQRKSFLLTKIRPFSDPIASRKTEVVQTFVDYQSAVLITRYLASKRPFSASFDFFLTRILSVSTEQTVAIRTKALKCLTMVVEADPSVLARQDMQMWVQNSFLDQSTAVREAAVDLVGKYVLSCHDLIDQYYEMLSLRILDTGVSVRKRVIKILRDICVECPEFPKIPEICVKMIRRVNDEDGIRKLVMEVFQNMWFTPVREDPLDKTALLRKVSHITDVVASCEKVGLDFFEQLLLSLFKPKDEREDVREKPVNLEPPKAVVTASQQIVNCLVEHVLRIEESSAEGPQQQPSLASQRFVACVATLFLFAKIRPQLLISHANTLEGYLSMKCQNMAEVAAIANIANILELVVPLLVNPAESFLALLEEDCVKLVFKNEKSVIDSCLACLGAVVNKITGNYKLVRDVFRRFQTILMTQATMLRENPMDPRLNDNRPLLRRAVYTIGLFLRYFDFTRPEVYGEFPANIVENVFHELLYLLETPGSDLQYFALQAIGNLCIRHYDFMLGNDLKKIYQQLLTESAEIKLKVQALSNIQLYLVEEELRMIKQDQEWKKNAKLENIKELGDVTSGMASTIVQIYLKQILEAFLHSELGVRLAAVRVVQLVLQQGLVHPIQIVPYLICMSTDEEQGVGATADKQLQEMEKKHPQFLQSQVLNGIRLSLQLQRILQGYKGNVLPGGLQHPGSQNQSQSSDDSHLDVDPDLPIVRGYRIRPKEAPSALNGFLYSLLRSAKPQRRAIALSLLKQFDEQNKNRLADLLYYADNLAYFPYQVVDEPLFLIHHVDIVISVTGSNLLQSFKESLVPLPCSKPQLVQPQPEVEPMDYSQVEYNPDDPLGLHSPTKMVIPAPAPAPLMKIPDILEDDEDEDIESLLKRIPENTRTLEEFTIRSQGCLLLLMLKQHLKDTYAITDTRISGYSPSDATKVYERPVTRRNAHPFDPKCTIANLKVPPSGETLENRRALVEQYLHFKQLMLRIDPEDGEEDGESKPVTIKIDQNLFTYPKARINPLPQQRHGRGSGPDTSLTPPTPAHNPRHAGHAGSHASSHYVVLSQPVAPTPGTPVAKVEPIVRVPKLTIVPLKFPGSDRKSHKIKDHHHHNKHKKSKHKKKKRHTISDDDDSDNPDSDPDFRL